MSDQRNLILAVVISVLILLGFQFFIEGPRMREAQQRAEAERNTAAQTTQPKPQEPAGGAPGTTAPPAAASETPRIPIDNGSLNGSIALRGARIDQVSLVNYRETIDPNSPEIQLLAPVSSAAPYFAEFGWVAGDPGTAVPDANTLWQAEGAKVGTNQPVTLRWDNGQGLAFSQKVVLDEHYMFTFTRSVTNNGPAPVTVYPFGLVSRWGTPHTQGYYILHEGPIGVLNGGLEEINYSKLAGGEKVQVDGTGGWLGFTDKYWLAAVIPEQDESVAAGFRHEAQGDKYQADFRGQGITIAPGASANVTDRLFAGAKEVKLLDAYQGQLGIPLFDRAVDFGWFYFLTKPIFEVLHFISQLVGNYGVAILVLTLIVKALFFPLANKSYRSMSAMKRLQPQMQDLRERYGDDKMKLNQEMMALYKNAKVNPMAGCLPIVIQIPVFFCLYKVLFVTIESRHAPFFGWIHDLSAPDPTNLFNLFGLLPFTPPHFLTLGAWPLIMGTTMFLQQRLNPQPADPMQARIFMFMPLMFIFLFATFPAGLVIYWSWNNLLSIAQQWLIMRRHGTAPAAPAKAPPVPAK